MEGGMIHLTDPMPLASLPASIRSQLPALALDSGRFNVLLREPGEAVCVVALDARGAIGWAVAEPDGLVGCFVAPLLRRQHVGRSLAKALLEHWPWKGVEPEARARPGSAGEAFWRAMGVVVKPVVTVQRKAANG